jgi:hypothetical protein
LIERQSEILAARERLMTGLSASRVDADVRESERSRVSSSVFSVKALFPHSATTRDVTVRVGGQLPSRAVRAARHAGSGLIISESKMGPSGRSSWSAASG